MGLGPINERVRFDHDAAQTLITKCTNAASVIEGQIGSRASWVSTAKKDFKGHFADLFTTNQQTAKSDADEVATRLRDVAKFVGDLAKEATAEQKRRDDAAAWKKDQEDRNLLEKGWDWVTDGNDAPVPDMPEPSTFTATAMPPKPRQTPTPGGGGSGSGTSSARPSDLRSFATNSRGANNALDGKPTACKSAYDTFVAGCGWGGLEASSVFSGFTKYLEANDEDVTWAKTIADAFEAAGGEGQVSTLSNSALAEALKAKGIDASRQDITIDPPTAYGNPPTSGYADDPVNAATGNFIENEVDLAFTGGNATLSLTRTYNSFNTGSGAFGRGWSSLTESRLDLDDEAARFVHPDGRVSVFPREGAGWRRATGESLWLERVEEGFVVSDNDGGRWEISADGRVVRVSRGAGTAVSWEYADQRLVRLAHERGRSIELTWDGDRVVAATGSDGRTATYDYAEDRLTSVVTALGARTYRWNDEALIAAVVDADGVVEAENTYDEHRRVLTQRSQHGRVSRFVYLPGNTTVVSDEDGSRSNTWVSDARGRLLRVTDAHEHTQTFAYDLHGNRVVVTERDGSSTIREYDDRGHVVREVTPSGADITYGYDALDRLTTVVTESGAVSQYEYADDGRNPSALIDPEGGRTELTWSDGLLTRVVDPMGVTVRFAYDAHGDLVAVVDALDHRAQLLRDERGDVVAAVTPMGHRTTFRHEAGLLVSRRDPDGGVWSFEHSAAGRLIATVDPTGARTTIEHDDSGAERRTVDPLGRALTRHLDDLGNLTAVEQPDGSQWRFAHDALSRLVRATAPDGSSWEREYDANGELIATIDPLGNRTSIVADVAGNTLTVADSGRAVSARFDPLGRVLSAHDDSASSVSTYDLCGRVVETLDGEGGLTRIERDAAGRPVRVTSPEGLVRTVEYDVCGRVTAVADALGRTERAYDADGRLNRMILPTGEIAEREFDECGRVISSYFPGRGVSRYRYDRVGRVVETSDTWNGRRTFRYDETGQLVAATSGVGGTTRFEYDALGRVTTIVDPLGNVTRRGYDSMGRLTEETDPLGRTTRAGHDACGRLAWHESPAGRRTEWTYDPDGALSSVSVNGRRISSYSRDRRTRTTIVTDTTRDGVESTLTLQHNHRGQLVRRSRDGRTTAWSYDRDGRRTSISGPDGTTTGYRYDQAGHLVEIDHPLLGRSTFVRDASGRMVEAVVNGQVQTWEYAGGELTAHTVGDADGFTRTEIRRSTGEADRGRITAITTPDRTVSFGYDEASQLTAATTDDLTSTWTYDLGGRLVRETQGSRAAGFAHDAAGQLRTRTVAGQTTSFGYDPEGRRVSEESSDGTRRTFRWNDRGWLGEIIDQAPDGSSRSTRLHVDASGQLVEVDGTEITWDSAAHSPTPIQVGAAPVLRTAAFTGFDGAWSAMGWRSVRATHPEDPWATAPELTTGAALAVNGDGGVTVGGLEWLGARALDPATRGFLSVDPIDPLVGAGWSGNPYAYAGNDPLHSLDPLGLKPLTDADLKAYNDAHNSGFAAAGDWIAKNKDWLIGGALVLAGGALMFTGVGGPAGMMLISAGADTLIQKATTGKVDYGSVIISGATGAIPGAGGLVGKLGVKSVAGKAIAGNVVTGMGTAQITNAYNYARGNGPHSFKDWAMNTAVGGAAGGFGGTAEVAGIKHAFKSAKRVEVPVDEFTKGRSLLGSPGDTVVLGRQSDTAVAADWPDHAVLNTPDWSPTLNDEFVQGAVDYQRPIYLASNPEGNLVQTAGTHAGQPTIFARELDQLAGQGFVRDGDYMVQP